MASAAVEAEIRKAGELREAGRFEEAVATYRRALAVEPALPNCWYNVGWMERRLGRPDAALEAYALALQHGAKGAEEIHLNRGAIFADDLNQPAAAEAAYLNALAIEPSYGPALLNLANLKEDQGARAEAVALYDRLLTLEPQNWEALARRANVTADFASGDPLIARLGSALARADLAAADRASLGFALGRALDSAGDYDAAFDAYAQANEASIASAPPGAQHYDPVAHERYVDALIAAFAAPEAPTSHAPAPTVFICGMFRSGSTLLEQAMAGHPSVSAGGEIPTLPALTRQLAPFPAAMAGVAAARIAEIAALYRRNVEELHPGAALVTDKRPDNFLLIGLAKRLFPGAKILHTVRDPMDTCLSTYFLHLDHSMAYAKRLDHIAHYYAQYRRLMAHWKALYPGDIHDFDYDAFVRAPRATLEPALAFCGLDWRDACLQFHDRASVVRTASVWQVREPLYQRSSGRSRRYGARLDGLRAALAPFYDPVS